MALFNTGDIWGAMEVQAEVLELMDGKDLPNYTLKEAQKFLERYQAALIEQADDDGSR